MTARHQEASERRHLRAAVLLLVTLAVITAVAFGRDHLGQLGAYEIRGQFTSANRLRVGSDVRIAGVTVGEVRAITSGPHDTSIVRMRMEEGARPVHADATLAIRPRLILEGNFYVDLRPGTPAAPELESGGLVPVGRTTTPVQADQVLTTFDRGTREALHGGLAAFAEGLGRAESVPRTVPSGARGARRTVRALEASLDSFGAVATAARGSRAGDLPRALIATGDVTSALARSPRALAEFMTNMRTVMGALAARDAELAAAIRGFDEVLAAAPEPLTRLDRGLPALRRLAVVARPLLRSMPGTVRDAQAFLDQLDGLSAPRELPGLLRELRPISATLPRLEPQLGALADRVIPVSRCLSETVVPALNMKLDDGVHSTGDPAWLDMLHAFTAAVGFAAAFDGNGVAVRAGITQGEGTLIGASPATGGVAVADGPPVRGIRPTWLGYGKDPQWNPGAPCAEQQLPNMRARSGTPPAWMRRGR